MDQVIYIIVYILLISTTKSAAITNGHKDRANGYQRDLSGAHNDSYTQTAADIPEGEEIPDPSALIIPGYNLPGHLFNYGKPFYVEKDPLTGAIDFNSKTPAGRDSNPSDYEYIDESPSTDTFDKSNIDRKDGNYGSHRPNDVNQLSPNFHDYLHLPVKYNPEKYVYPLISSSYANTKIQGNLNSYNHKQHYVTTYKPTVSPTYYTTKSSIYYTPEQTSTTEKSRVTTQTTTVTTPKALEDKRSTSKAPDGYTSTEPAQNLLNSPMNHPSYLTTKETDYDYDYVTRESTDNQAMLTTEPPHIYITNKPTTTKKPYSIFDELFGDYDDPSLLHKPLKPPSLFSNLPPLRTDNKYNKNPSSSNSNPPNSSHKNQSETNVDNSYYHNSGSVSHVYPESNENSMYEYEYDYNNYSEEPNNIHITNPVPPDESMTTTTTQEVSIQKSQENKNEVKKNITAKENETSASQNNSHLQQNYPNIRQNYTNFQKNYVVANENKKPLESNMKPNDSINNNKNVAIKSETLPEKQENNFISITTQIYDDYNNEHIEYKSSKSPNTYTQPPSTTKVTSMPLGENHPSGSRLPVITLTQNIKESLNREKVEITTKAQNPVQYEKTESMFTEHKPPVLHSMPSTSNIHIAPDQDVVSFVVGNQQSVDGGHFIGTALKEEPYISNSFRPLYTHQNPPPAFDQIIYNRPTIATHSYSPQTTSNYNFTAFPEASTTINVQPIIGSEASLSIGMPADEIKIVPGQVVDAKLDINDNIEYPKEPGSKVVFPEDDLTTFAPPLLIPNREVLSLYSKPMFHQLPADLTPPSEPEVKPIRSGSPRPPWDPRPGHFYQGRPEYARPPRPHKPEIYKRIDGLPNILPQFRPNAKVSNGHYMDSVGTVNSGYIPRQPLLDRPSNRPIGFFEKLHPPPPPPPKRIHDLRKVTALEQDSKHDRYRYEERILNIPSMKHQQEHFAIFQTPPIVPVANRKTEDEAEIATLQMIQAKQSEKLETIKPNVPPPFQINYQESTEKPLYVVYPVNSTPLKLDVLDNDKRETVVVGTRGEQLPLPPSKINHDTAMYEQRPVLKPKDRNDSPILKPQNRPNIFPIKTDFPYILERPDPTFLNIPVSSTSTDITYAYSPESTISSVTHKNDYNYQSNNQWTSIESESRIVNGNKINSDQISATLKTYTEKPIAIAYTPTEPSNEGDKYSIPNFGRPVISDTRTENNKHVPHHHGVVSNNDSEFTVSAVMHTHPQIKLKTQNEVKYYEQKPTPIHIRQPQENLENHKLNLDIDTTHVPTKLDFQAPFHASVSVDSEYQGWSVVTRNTKNEIDRSDVNVTPSDTPETSSEFDIEKFKPQLFGGFKPIYNYPNDKDKSHTTATSERQEK